MFRKFPGEEWKIIAVEHDLKMTYAVSNFGRLLSFEKSMDDARLIKPGRVEGYTTFRYKVYTEKKINYYSKMMHNLVATYFIEKESEDQKHVIHLDRNKANNHVKNLKWATREEHINFKKESPLVIEAMKKLVEHNKKRDGAKMTESKVRLLKKKLADPNRRTRLKILAKQFGISEMQLYRIKSGANWGHVKID
jgi:hypothetical protein